MTHEFTMRVIRGPHVVAILFFAWILLSCNEPTSPEPQPSLPPQSSGRTPVHFAVGNTYNWRFIRTGFGTFFQWNSSSLIVSDSVAGSHSYYKFDSGELLRSSRDTVFTYAGNSSRIYYHFNVTVGDTVPFLGHTFRVTEVDTEEVLGRMQIVIRLDNDADSTTNITSASYATLFGVIRLSMRTTQHVTTQSLHGARLGNATFGNLQE